MVMSSRTDSKWVVGTSVTYDGSVPESPSTTVFPGEYLASRTVLNVWNPGSTTGDRKTPNSHGFDKIMYQFGTQRTLTTNYTGGPGGIGKTVSERLVTYGQEPIAAAFVAEPLAPGAWVAVSWDGLLDDCLEKIFSKIRGQNNLAVDLAERKETISMIKNTLNLKKLIVNFVKKMSKDKTYKRLSRTRRRERAHEYVSSKWLEYRYGWLPLMHSIYDAADNLKRDLSARTITVKARRGQTFNGKIIEGLGYYSMPKGVVQYSTSFRRELGLRFNLPGGAQLSDWTTLSPANFAWEVMTLSFVADWITNMGQQLSLMESCNLYAQHFAGGYDTTSVKCRRVAHYLGSSVYPPTGYWEAGYPFAGPASALVFGSAYVELTSKGRDKLTSLPRPTGFRVDIQLNANRVVDAAAICSGFARKLFK